MASTRFGLGSMLLVLGIILVVMPGQAAAFGAGNIPGIAQIEGHNWRHGDIEDMLKTIAFLNGKKWTTLLVGRVYFGNWLRDYSQAIDVAGLKGVNAATLRILVWVLSFLANGYATEEFEVTEERLGTYRPEEHIDNPLGYPDDAQTYDKRLRPAVRPIEVEIDPDTGMKNYIANERGDWSTSAGYLRFSLSRCIHFGRMYTHGSKSGNEDDLCEALRCLGQALHCMEDFPAHSNYCELALRELGYHGVFPHCGTETEINLRGKRVYPIVTGTFGGVDFFHSVLGEANDHFTQAEVSEVDQMDAVLKRCEQDNTTNRERSGSQSRGLGDAFGFGGRANAGDFISLVGQLPGVGGGFASEARNLQQQSDEQRRRNESSRSQGDSYQRSRASGGTNQNIVPGMSADFDPVETARKIYPILQFRDKIVKAINRGIAKIPGLEKLLEHISETLTAFVLGLLAPFIRPIITQVTKVLKQSSSTVIDASANSQLEPWKDPRCSNPTHSMLSKDHFTNILNSCAGRVAATILQYTVPRVLYAWENPGVPVDEVLNDVLRAFHHPAIRDERVEIQRDMYNTVRKWVDEYPKRHDLNSVLGSASVKAGRNHVQPNPTGTTGSRSMDHGGCGGSTFPGHGQPTNSLWSQVKTRDLDDMGVGDGHGGLRPNYAENRPSSSRPDSSAGRKPSPQYGYQNSPQGEAASYSAPYPPDQPSRYDQGPHNQVPQYGGGSQYGQQGPPQGQYGRPQYGGEAASYGNPGYGGSPPQQQPPYGGPPPGQGGYGGYPGQQPQGYGQSGGYGQGPPPQQYGQQPPYPSYGQQPPYGQGPPGGYDNGPRYSGW